MSLLGKKILVTGGNGYLGNYFAARFVQQKASVMALSRSIIGYLDRDPGTSTPRTLLFSG